MITAAALVSLAMQCAPLVHPDTISDIAKTESGFHPYAIAEIVPLKGGGSRVVSHMPESKDDALKIVEDIKERKHRYSVGVMQITSTNFPLFGVTAEQMFNPCKNLSIAEKIITDCYKRGGTLKRALSCYYSGNFDTGLRPEKSFSNTSYVQRIGYKAVTNYIVPSTREDKITHPATKTDMPVIIWPENIARGELINTPPQPEAHYPVQVIRGVFISTEKEKS